MGEKNNNKEGSLGQNVKAECEDDRSQGEMSTLSTLIQRTNVYLDHKCEEDIGEFTDACNSRSSGLNGNDKEDEVVKVRERFEENEDSDEEDLDESTALETSERTTLPARPSPVCAFWTRVTEDIIHKALLKWVVALACYASTYPKRCVGGIVFLSFALMGIGVMTNLKIVFDQEEMFTPLGSLPAKHGKWLYGGSGFNDTCEMTMVIHANGKSVLNRDAMIRAFEAINTLQSVPGYAKLCKTSAYVNLDGSHDCWIWSPTEFWNYNLTSFEINVKGDQDMVQKISQSRFPDGTPVYQESIYGNYTTTPSWFVNSEGKNKTFDLLTYVPSFILNVGLPDTDESYAFQEIALNQLKDLKKTWELQSRDQNPHSLQLEFFTLYAYELEYQRALMKDMPLVPLVFYVMLLFTCIAFHKLGMGTSRTSRKNPLEPSRFSLGILSTFTIGMSLLSGYGLMFCVGVPFTNIAEMIPFIILGVGLDDTFIITGAYFRLLSEESERQQNDKKAITSRIKEAMEEVGMSITLTSATTVFAFCLGSRSTIPGIRWVCVYASITIFIDYIYQVTLFVALLTLDERRTIRARAHSQKRGDYQLIAGVYASVGNALPEAEVKDSQQNSSLFTQQIMAWYGRQLLRPISKVLVLVAFASLFGFSVYRTTLLTQEFNIEDYVPKDSYTKPFFEALDEYSSIKVPMAVYFRNVNQSDPTIQDQMRNYIEELSQLPQIRHEPDFCWVRDLNAFMKGQIFDTMDEEEAKQAKEIAAIIQYGNKTFTQQLDMVMNIATIRDVYGSDIVRDKEGGIKASRCYLFVRYIDLKSVRDQVSLLQSQREITERSQPMLTAEQKATSEGLSFFTFADLYYYWELYDVAVRELISNTISGIIAVTIVGFVLIPHWSATFFVFPIIIMLYFNLLGTLQLCGVHINPVTYVTIVIAIGLLVDFLMHILLRYYESTKKTREAKVIDALETMGASMFMGGFTTWLGVIPLSLSSTKIFNTIFIAFFAMVSWGLLTSLILMPVILSLVGPLVCTLGNRVSTAENKLRDAESSRNNLKHDVMRRPKVRRS